jgi:hypothetical protein
MQASPSPINNPAITHFPFALLLLLVLFFISALHECVTRVYLLNNKRFGKQIKMDFSTPKISSFAVSLICLVVISIFFDLFCSIGGV